MKGNHYFVFILSAIFFAGTIFIVTQVSVEEPQNKIPREKNIPTSNNIAIQTTPDRYNKLSDTSVRGGSDVCVGSASTNTADATCDIMS